MRVSNPAMGGHFNSVLSNLKNVRVGKAIDRIRNSFHSSSIDSLVKRHEIAVMYFGRTSEFLMATSERVMVPDEGCTLAQLLRKLRGRGGRWAEELDDSHLVCTVDGREAHLFEVIEAGNAVCIASTKSVFEA